MNTLNVNDELRKKITRLEFEIAELKRPPYLRIIRGKQEIHQMVYRLEFQFRDFRHSTLVTEEMYRDMDYRQHCFRYGVEATVRALADKELERMITVEVRDDECI